MVSKLNIINKKAKFAYTLMDQFSAGIVLTNKKELNKLFKQVKNTGLTIIPLKVFINEKGYAKVLISLAKGKKLYDKRQSIKNRENKIQLDRIKKKKNN